MSSLQRLSGCGKTTRKPQARSQSLKPQRTAGEGQRQLTGKLINSSHRETKYPHRILSQPNRQPGDPENALASRADTLVRVNDENPPTAMKKKSSLDIIPVVNNRLPPSLSPATATCISQKHGVVRLPKMTSRELRPTGIEMEDEPYDPTQLNETRVTDQPSEFVNPEETLLNVYEEPQLPEPQLPEPQLPDQDQALKTALNFCERHNWTGDANDRPQGLTDLEEELDFASQSGDELSTLDRYFVAISERDERSKVKTTAADEKSKVKKKGPMRRAVRSEEEPEDRSENGMPSKRRKHKAKGRTKRKEPGDDDFALSAEDRGLEESDGRPEQNTEVEEQEDEDTDRVAEEDRAAGNRKPAKRRKPNSDEKAKRKLKASDKKSSSTIKRKQALKPVDILNPKAVLKSLQRSLPEEIRRYQGLAGPDLFDDNDNEKSFDAISAPELLDQLKKSKQKRPTAAEMRKKLGDDEVIREVPSEERKSDAELLQIGLDSVNQENKERWRAAPYCWNAKGFLYDKYYYLVDQRDESTQKYIWSDELIWKFARDHKVNVFLSRQVAPGLLNAKGELRQRAPRQTIAQRHYDGRYIKDVPEMRSLTQASRSQVIYGRQKEIENTRTEGVQRMKKEHRELEQDAMKVNERIAASFQVGTALNQTIKKHTKDLSTKFANALIELAQARQEVGELQTSRQELQEVGRRYAATNQTLIEERDTLKAQVDRYKQTFGPLQTTPTQQTQAMSDNILHSQPTSPLIATTTSPHSTPLAESPVLLPQNNHAASSSDEIHGQDREDFEYFESLASKGLALME